MPPIIEKPEKKIVVASYDLCSHRGGDGSVLSTAPAKRIGKIVVVVYMINVPIVEESGLVSVLSLPRA